MFVCKIINKNNCNNKNKLLVVGKQSVKYNVF